MSIVVVSLRGLALNLASQSRAVRQQSFLRGYSNKGCVYITDLYIYYDTLGFDRFKLGGKKSPKKDSNSMSIF